VSNFDFLKDYDRKLYKSAIKIEESVRHSPGAVQKYATPFLQRVLELLLEEIGKTFNSRKDYYYQLDAVYREGKIKYSFKDKIYEAYQLRSRLHDDIEEMERSELAIVRQLYRKLFYIAKKLYVEHNPDYDKSEGVPEFVPIEIDTSERELDLIELPDFHEAIEMDYDFCIVCGASNHESDSLCCDKCNRVMDNANNFISISNHFGKNGKFTKRELVEYGIPEGYVNQLVDSMVRERMLEVKGIQITFNNMHWDEYLAKIDNYIAVCELITKFRENKMTPSEIKQTREYKLGSRENKAFYQFFKIVNREIKYLFEEYLVTNRDIWKSIDYSTITQEQLKRWYEINMGHYQKGRFNEAFKTFNDFLIEEYLDLASQGILEAEIRQRLNVSDTVYNFWKRYDSYFERNLKNIKIELLSEAIKDGKTTAEAIDYAGVTPREYEDIVKFSDFKDNDFSRLRKREMESRKKDFIKYLYNFDLRIACSKVNLTVEEFYEIYDSSDVNSDFYIKSTRMLMDKFLTQRRFGKTENEALEKTLIKDKYLQRWTSWEGYDEFRKEYLRVKVGLVIRGFKQKKPLDEIAETSGVNADVIRRNIFLGECGSEMFRPLYEYYEEKIIPKKLSKFLESKNHHSFRQSLKVSNLTEEEFNKYSELGKSGDKRYAQFYEELYMFKRGIYLKHRIDGKSQKIALRESGFTPEEYEEHKEYLSDSISTIKHIIVLEEIRKNNNSSMAANKANVTVDEIYDWYFKGRDGDEEYEEFYDAFHRGYVKPAVNSIQDSMDRNLSHLDFMIKHNKDKFTKKDVDIWVKNGLLNNNVLVLLKNRDEKDKDESKFDSKEMLKEMGVKDHDKISKRKKSPSSSILSRNEEDIEKMKKQILKK